VAVDHQRRSDVGTASWHDGSEEGGEGAPLPEATSRPRAPGDETDEAGAAHARSGESLGRRGRLVVFPGEERTGECEHDGERATRAVDDGKTEAVVAFENEAETFEGTA
jgi:hypothetical protein